MILIDRIRIGNTVPRDTATLAQDRTGAGSAVTLPDREKFHKRFLGKFSPLIFADRR